MVENEEEGEMKDDFEVLSLYYWDSGRVSNKNGSKFWKGFIVLYILSWRCWYDI